MTFILSARVRHLTDTFKQQPKENAKIALVSQSMSIHRIHSTDEHQQQQRHSSLSSDDVSSSSQQSSLLHEQVLREQSAFEEKIHRVNKRKEWLRSNELLLRTFLSYCSLHGSSAG